MSGNGSMFSEFKAGAVLPSTVTTATSGGPELNAMKSSMAGGKKSKRSKKSRRAKHARKTHKKTRHNKHHRK